jgi:FkbM family methyltransferase
VRVFVDIGSHVGQTIEEVLEPRWGFDLIYAIEPMPFQAAVLRQRFTAEPRVKLHEFALANRDGALTMYGTNDELEASVFPEKDDVDTQVRTTVRCVDAASFFEEIARDVPQIVVNLNAEGAEVLILDRLIETGWIHAITELLVDFDIRKVRGREHNEVRIRAALTDAGFDRWTSEYPDLPTHREQIAAWLEVVLGV